MFDQLKKLLKHSSIYGIGAIISPVISFIMLPIYTRFLTPENYGLLALTGVVGLFINSIFSFGINSGMIRIYYDYKESEERNSVITSALISGFISSLIVVAILLAISPYIAKNLFNVEESETLFRIIVITFLVNNSGSYLSSILLIEEKAKLRTFFNVFSLMITLSLNVLFVVVLERGVMGILEAGLISQVISTSLMIPFTVRKKTFNFSLNKIRKILYFGIPLIPTNVADIILNLSDRYFIENYLGLTEVGLYSLGYRIAGMLSIIVLKPFGLAWTPYMFSIVERSDAKEIYAKVLVYFTLVSFFIGLILSIFAHEALMMLATKEYLSAYKIVPLIVLSYIFFGMTSILIAGIHIKKKSKYVAILFIASALINLLLNYFLIPKYGMWGAAIATICAYIFLNMFYFIFSQRLYPIKHEFDRIFKIVLLSVIIYFAASISLFKDSLFLTVSYKLVVLFTFPFLLYVIKFYRKEELAKISEYSSKILVKLKIKKDISE